MLVRALVTATTLVGGVYISLTPGAEVEIQTSHARKLIEAGLVTEVGKAPRVKRTAAATAKPAPDTKRITAAPENKSGG